MMAATGILPLKSFTGSMMAGHPGEPGTGELRA